jgi:hypothetical protein
LLPTRCLLLVLLDLRDVGVDDGLEADRVLSFVGDFVPPRFENVSDGLTSALAP